MTNAELRAVMRYYLDHLNGTGDEITDETIHNDVLAEDDGPPSSRDVYRGNVSWSLSTSGNGKPKWPSDWMKLTVAKLADKLVPPLVEVAIDSSAAPAWFKALHGNER